VGRHLALALSVALGLPGLAAADWVRDEIHVNMRTGPGTRYRITQVLKSGDQARRIDATDDWIKVRTAEGQEGWIPNGYMSKEPPASLALPETRAKLTRAESQIQDLEGRLDVQADSIAELEQLRARVEQLTTENTRLAVSTRWKDYLMGATLLALGVLVGMAIPRGSTARARKIKL
jgi:SH3 domain protein